MMDKEAILKLVGSTEKLEGLVCGENPSPGLSLSCKGTVHTKWGNVELEIKFPDSFPYSKPIIRRLTDNDLSLPIAHVDREGTICYIDDNNYVVDFNNPLGIIAESLDRAIGILEEYGKETQQQSFVAEFNSFWQAYPDATYCLSLLSPQDNIGKVTLCSTPKNTILGRDKTEIEEYLSRTGQSYGARQLKWQSAAYIPLPLNTKVSLPPSNNFWTKEQVWKFIKHNIGEWDSSKIKRMMGRDQLQPIIFRLPTNDGESIHFGIHFEKTKDGVASAPLIIERMDKEYVLPRAGAKSSIHDKKVMIIGCGAIGGYIAVNLGQLGVGNLALVDPQRYSTSNVHRHILGAKGEIFAPKVNELKKEIEGKFIHTNIDTIPKNIEDIIREEKDIFEKVDLVIIATGKPSSNFWLNSYLIKNHPDLPAIYTWVDPYGIGGHTLVTNNTQKRGCYQCLYKSDPALGMYNMASFAKKGQSFLKTQSGCAGLFVPYSTLDAQQTGIQTARVATRILEGKEADNPLISWKGDNNDFLSNGFQLSPRYNQNKEELWKKRNCYPNQKCPICQGKAKELCLDVLKEAG